MTPTDLLSAIRAALDDLERKARTMHARTCGHDDIDADAPCNCDWHVATVLRRAAAERRVLERHEPNELPATHYRPALVECSHCVSMCHSRSGLACEDGTDAPWPCVEILDLADRLGIDPE